LIIANLLAALANMITQGLEQPERAQSIDVGSVFRDIERHSNVALGPKVVHFIGSDPLENVPER
jgi:hypothetical protein